MNAVTRMKWLIRRELWEHKGSLLWAPAVVGAFMVALIGSACIWKFGIQGRAQTRIQIDGREFHLGEVWNSVGAEQKSAIVEVIANVSWIAATPLIGVLSFVVFFYCLSSLYEERRDRSILFWKSLPLSDRMTVSSKVLVATVIAPLITMAISVVTALLLLIIGGLVAARHGLNVFGDVFTQPALYLAPLKLLALVPVYLLWSLPTVGWLMMVSSWARSKVFLWAVGAPLILGAVIKWSEYLGSGLSAKWYMDNIVLHGLGRLLPGWLTIHGAPLAGHSPAPMFTPSGFDTTAIVVHSYKLLLTPEALLGAAAGLAMLYAAVRLRRWKDEG